LVNLDEYTTLPKGNEEQIQVRKLSIAERAQRFSQHPKVGASHVMYILYNIDGNAFLSWDVAFNNPRILTLWCIALQI